MTIINAYLGGSGGGVPVGKCMLNVAWNPSDGNNKSGATVSAVIGSTTVTGTTDSSGNASLLVGTGSCTVTVTPASGSYTISSVTVTAESTTTKTVVVNGQGARKVLLVMPYTLTTTAWNIKNSSNVQQTSGSGAFNDKEVSLIDGTYTLSVTAYGVTKTLSFTVSASSTRIDCTSITCLVTFSLPSQLAVTMSVAGTALASNQRFVCVLRNSSNLAYTGTVTTQLNGSAIATVTGGNMKPSSASITVTPTVVGASKLITATKTLSVPAKGAYKILVIGGGGGATNGKSSPGGGGGGHIAMGIYALAKTSYTVTIGAGGAGGSSSAGSAGGATSFGSIVSALGGNGGGNGNTTYTGRGGDGGSGGGSGAQSSSAGGTASFGGGGGGGTSYGGGAGGPYGGAGGGYGSNGTDGVAIDNSDSFFTSTGSGYTGGSYGGSGGSGCGSGGGGGYGAKGGNGAQSGGGGGGGGIAGGDGGNGTATTSAGHGKGYGSGGGGAHTANTFCGGGGGGLYNIAQSGVKGANGACIIMWVG